jgi:hypothetical protein
LARRAANLYVRRLFVDTVSLLTIEDGKDLIVAFAVMDHKDPTQIRSLILHRAPMFESLLDESERGVQVSLEGQEDEEQDILEGVRWDERAATLQLKTRLTSYELDLRKVDGPSIASMRKLLKKMNHDRSIALSGV